MAGTTRWHKGIFCSQTIISIMPMTGRTIRPPQVQVTGWSMITTGVQCGTTQMTRHTEIILVGFVGIIETVFTSAGEENDLIPLNGTLDDGQVVTTMTGMAFVAGRAEGPFDGIVIGAIAVRTGQIEGQKVRAFAEGIAVCARWDLGYLATIFIMTFLANWRQIGLVGVDKADTSAAIWPA